MNTPEIEKKLEFLHKLLKKNPDIKKQFEVFIKETGEQPADDPLEHIQLVSGELMKELEALDLDEPDWEHYTPRHSGYIEEWEARMHLAQDMVTEVFEDYRADLELCFSEGKTDLALLYLVSGYNACLP